MFVNVIIYNNKLDFLTYKTDINLKIGDLVTVPIRNNVKLAIVINVLSHFQASYELKMVIAKLSISFKSELVKFLLKFAQYNCITNSDAIKLFIPATIVNDLINNNLKDTKFTNNKILDDDTHKLNVEQAEIFNKLYQLQSQNKYYSVVIEGITGSGKTELYFHIAKKVITEQNSQVLILLPEISLTTQIIKRAEHFFGTEIYIWNSLVTPKNKKEIWQLVQENKIKIIIGTRSAIFLPFSDLKLIIIDEEHDQSYKQEEQLVYHGRDMAILRAYTENIGIILGSATLSIETYYNIKYKNFHHFKLTNRFGKAILPNIELVDMRETKEKPPKNYWISTSLKNAIAQNLTKNEQSLLYLNRRGFAPLSLCNNCGMQVNCKNCSSWLVYHKAKDILLCHYCNYSINVPTICDNCHAEHSISFCGPGVERISHEVEELFPKARISILTKDTMNNIEMSREKIEEIVDNKVDIIIGTQLIAKGYNFPELTLVGIIDADIGLKGADLKAEEKTVQLLTQVGGRAGRTAKEGKVILQTYDPDNPVIQSIKDNDIETFMNKELELRQETDMPPFSKMAAIVISSKNEDELQLFSKKIVRHLPKIDHITIMGPIKSAIYKLQNSYRMRILIRYPRSFNIQEYLQKSLKNVKMSPAIRVKFDIDPINFI